MKKVISISAAALVFAIGFSAPSDALAAKAKANSNDADTAAFIDCDSNESYSSGDIKLKKSQLYPKGKINVLDTGAACGTGSDHKTLYFPKKVKSDLNKNSVMVLATGSIKVTGDLQNTVVSLTSLNGSTEVADGVRILANDGAIYLHGAKGVKVGEDAKLLADYGIVLLARRGEVAYRTFLNPDSDASVSVGAGANLDTMTSIHLKANNEVSVGDGANLTAKTFRFMSAEIKGRMFFVAPTIRVASSARLRSTIAPDFRASE